MQKYYWNIFAKKKRGNERERERVGWGELINYS